MTITLRGQGVSRVGFGAMQLAERGQLGAPPRDQAIAVLRSAVEIGVRHIDTAEFYGAGAANALIREALHPYAEELALVSKVGAEHHPERGLVAAQRPEQLRAGVEANLHSLQVDRLAVVNLRRMDTRPGIVATGDQLVDLDSQLAELMALRDEGKLGGIGLSNVSPDQLTASLPAGITCVQNSYSLLERTAEPLLKVCADNDVAWVPFFPLGSGFPNNPKVSADPTVMATAARLDVTPAQVGLAWLLAHDANTLLIPGTSSLQHLAENVAAADLVLDQKTMRELDLLAG